MGRALPYHSAALGGWSEETSELPHVSFSLEAWRGFAEIGAVWASIGSSHARPDLVSLGAALLNESTRLMHDIRVAIDRSAIQLADGFVCHPYAITVFSTLPQHSLLFSVRAGKCSSCNAR